MLIRTTIGFMISQSKDRAELPADILLFFQPPFGNRNNTDVHRLIVG